MKTVSLILALSTGFLPAVQQWIKDTVRQQLGSQAVMQIGIE